MLISPMAQAVLSFISVALFVIGLIGNGFEMRKIRLSIPEGQLHPKNAFLDRRNLKWYAIIGIGLVLWVINRNYT
jgi:hypothetical protein